MFVAIGEQFVFICMDSLFDIHGKLEKSEQQLVVGFLTSAHVE
jgi:hypothetical protein